MSDHRLLRALARQPVDRTPVWLMRQAGRYLPEYRALRERAGSFLALCTTPELACEATLQPLARFDLDAAIVFSDILTVPAAMGMKLEFLEGEGPRFEAPLRDQRDVDALGRPDPEGELGYVLEAVRLVHRELDARVPLIGFAGSPWTLATYMVEGGGSSQYRFVKGMLFDRPELLHRLLDELAASVLAYLAAQIRAGADAVMIFDTWGGVLGPSEYREFSLDYMTRVVEGLRGAAETAAAPVILFTKGGGAWLEWIADSGCAAVGIDWTVDIGLARARIGDRAAVQGNLDPCVLYASPERVRAEVARVLAAWGEGPGHVFNLGHGIQPFVDPDRVTTLVDAVHELSAPYHVGG
ncbi:MAG: uroporphyrinogen decarboxylase [Gammaproteobacteria bacterium]|nr:uroporphyrinogen decarboxylase [Gammaproteobacteria bacterium]